MSGPRFYGWPTVRTSYPSTRLTPGTGVGRRGSVQGPQVSHLRDGLVRRRHGLCVGLPLPRKPPAGIAQQGEMRGVGVILKPHEVRVYHRREPGWGRTFLAGEQEQEGAEDLLDRCFALQWFLRRSVLSASHCTAKRAGTRSGGTATSGLEGPVSEPLRMFR